MEDLLKLREEIDKIDNDTNINLLDFVFGLFFLLFRFYKSTAIIHPPLIPARTLKPFLL